MKSSYTKVYGLICQRSKRIPPSVAMTLHPGACCRARSDHLRGDVAKVDVIVPHQPFAKHRVLFPTGACNDTVSDSNGEQVPARGVRRGLPDVSTPTSAVHLRP